MRFAARLFLALFLAVAPLLPSPGFVAHAQPAGEAVVAPDYEKWQQSAQEVTAFLEEKTGSDSDVDSLRRELEGFRAAFVAQQGANTAQIATLKEQIAALGPVPEGDAVETSEVADRRKALHDELAKAQEPVVRAVEAQAQADALLRALADLERTRQANRVLRLSTSPLDPRGWVALVDEGQVFLGHLIQEAGAGPARREEGWIFSRFLGPAFSVLVGMLVLLGGWRLARRGAARLVVRFPVRVQALTTFVLSVFQIVLPVAGLHMVWRGLEDLGVFGPWWRAILDPLTGSFVAALLGFWIVRRFFDSERTHGDYTLPARRSARGYAMALVAIFAAYRFVSQTALVRVGSESVFLGGRVDVPQGLSEAAAGAAVLPLIALAAVALWGLDGLRRGAIRVQPALSEEEEAMPAAEWPYRVRMLSVITVLAKYVGVLGVLSAVAGYLALANHLVWSMVLTLAAALFLLAMHDFITQAWGAVRNKPADQGLSPVVAGFGLLGLFSPLALLAWGVRPSSLWNMLGVMGQGFPVGDVTLSPRLLVFFLLTLFVGIVATRIIKGVFKTTVLPRTRLDSGAQSAAVSGIGYIGVFLAVLVAVMSAGIDLSSLAIVAGALSVGIGFGLQNIISNFVSGIILLIERPISVGDWIDAGGQQGTVRSISVRSTRIRTFDNTEVIVPNSDLISNSVTNWTRGSTIGRITIPVTVAFGTDTEQVEAVLLDIGQRYEEVLNIPAPQVFFAGFSASGYVFELRAFLRDIRENIRVSTQIRHAIVKAFAQDGIVIPPVVQEIRVVDQAVSVPAPGLGMVQRG